MKRYCNKFRIKKIVYKKLIKLIKCIKKRKKEIELNRECWHE